MKVAECSRNSWAASWQVQQDLMAAVSSGASMTADDAWERSSCLNSWHGSSWCHHCCFCFCCCCDSEGYASTLAAAAAAVGIAAAAVGIAAPAVILVAAAAAAALLV